MAPKSPKNVVSRAAFARRAGVSRTAITKACKGALARACVDDRIDLDHAAAVAYLASKPKPAEPEPPPKPAPKKRKAAPAAATKARRALAGVVPEEYEKLDSVEPFASLTLRELCDQFGSRRAFKDWLDALKKIEDIRKTRLDNDETEGALISRELVKTHVFGALDASNRRLLTDMPKTASRRIYTAAQNGTPLEEVELMLREIVASQLRPLKAAASRALRKKA